MTLADLSPMQKCKISDIRSDGLLGQRLLDFGLCPGTEVTFIRKAPFADPIHIKIGECHVVLRNTEASCIEVTLDV